MPWWWQPEPVWFAILVVAVALGLGGVITQI